MACTYLDRAENVTYTDVAFDAHVASIWDELSDEQKKESKNTILYSLDKRESVISKIDDIKSKFSSILANSKQDYFAGGTEPDGGVKLHDVKGYMGVTSYITQYGHPKKGIDHPIVTGFNENTWTIRKKLELSRLGKTDAEIEEIIKKIKDGWKKLQIYGTEIHSIYEAIMGDKTIPNTPNLDDSIRKDVIKQAEEFKKQLISKYGGGDPTKVKFYPELDIASKNIESDLKELLSHRVNPETGAPEPINAISGTIDLLVVDSEGKTHIFDYKTSRKKLDPDEWDIVNNALIAEGHWDSTKKLSLKEQLAAYNVMLEQYGVTGSTCEVVPIYLDINYADKNKYEISGLNSVVLQKTMNVPETTTGSSYANWKAMLPSPVKINAESELESAKKFEKLFPFSQISAMQVKQFEANIEYYRSQVKNVSSDDTEHYGKDKFYFVKYEGNGKREYAKDEEDLERKLQAYVEGIREKKDNELFSLASTIRHALSGQISLDDFIQNYKVNNRNFLETQFGRYIKEGWELVSDDGMIANGFFLFRYDGRSELVVITNTSIHPKINLGLGDTLLGKYIENTYVDSKEILPANNGNIAGMKAMIFIADHPELFKSVPLTQMVVINPWRGERTYVNNSQWVTNYNRLIEASGEKDYEPISNELFYDDLVSLLSIVDSNLRCAENPGELKGFSMEGVVIDGNVAQFTEEYIQKALSWMRAKYTFLENGENEMIGNENIWIAYNYLNRALLELKGLHVYDEQEVGKWFSSGIRPGLNVASSGYSGSTNFRVFDDVMQQFSLEVRMFVEKTGRPLIPALNNFYKSMGRKKLIGGEANYFLRWFVRDENGNITKEFRLKNPDSHDFDGNPEERTALKTWLEVMAQLRWPKSKYKTEIDWENEIERKKASGEYYQVPLTEAAFGRQVKGLGFIKTIKNKFDQYAELTQDVFAGSAEEKIQWRQGRDKYGNKINPHRVMYNKFQKNAKQREALIEEHGIGFFETNLEDVINQALVAYAKEELSKKYVPIIDAMRTSLRVSKQYGGARAEETLESFDKLVKSKFYGEPIVDKSLQPYMRWMQALKSFFSKLQLGFNFRSMFRELFQGTWMGVSRSAVQLMPGVTWDTYKNGAWHVIRESHKNFSNVSLLQQMNMIYGMANYSMGQIASQRRLNWYGIKNFRSDTLFLTATAPDFQHRMSILVAKMMGDGCWEAHSLDENGFLKYDFKKDKRFKAYVEGNTKDPDYLAQKTEYETRIAELIKAGIKKADGTDYKIGDDLEMAYLPKEVQAIKNFADLLYGHYDEESKSMMNDMFLGSAFLQYKTYATSRVEQWVMTPGIYNTEMLQHDTDPVTGEKLYKVHSKDLDENGMPVIEIKSRSQIENFDELMENNQIEACVSWKGIPMEGMGRSYFKFLKDMKSLNWEGLKEKWDNPVERDNIILGLHDCLLMSLFMLLITGLFGWILGDGTFETDHTKVAKQMQKNGWGESLAYNIAWGSFNDFPIWKTIGNVFGDMNPSVVTSATKLVSTAGNVIMGDKTLFQAVTNTIGAAADLKGWADVLAQTTA